MLKMTELIFVNVFILQYFLCMYAFSITLVYLQETFITTSMKCLILFEIFIYRYVLSYLSIRCNMFMIIQHHIVILSRGSMGYILMYIYIYMCVCVCMHACLYIYTSSCFLTHISPLCYF
jgi:hypothetical protein